MVRLGGLGVRFARVAENLELVSACTKKFCEHMKFNLEDGP